MNILKIRPLYDRIVVKRIEERETTRRGIIIPDSAQEKPGLLGAFPRELTIRLIAQARGVVEPAFNSQIIRVGTILYDLLRRDYQAL